MPSPPDRNPPDPRSENDPSEDPRGEQTVDFSQTLALGGSPRVVPDEDRGHYLVVRHGANPGLRIEVAGDAEVVVGRGERCDLRLADPAVSSRHCSFKLVGTNLWVRDLGSTNGTFLDGARLERPTCVPTGADLQLGSQILHHEQRNRLEVEQDRELVAELERARAYVEALLPARLEDPDVRTDWCYVPCAMLGGDAFGYHRLADGSLAIYLIDVRGHGTAAALHSVSVINTLRRQALAGVDFAAPASVLGGLNRIFPMADHDGMFFSAWYGVYAAAERRLTYASAGHPPALLAAAPGVPLAELAARRLAAGILPDIDYAAESRVVPPGARLYLYSDGIFEFETPRDGYWSHEAFVALVAEPGGDPVQEIARIRDGVRRAAGTPTLPDDLSLMVLQFP